MQNLSYLAFAAGYRRISFVLIEHGQLATWHTSCVAAKSTEAAREFTREFIEVFSPDVIVMEKLETAGRKGAKAKALLQVIRDEAEKANAQFLPLKRKNEFRTRQAEASNLVNLFPELADKVPHREYCDNEPHHMVLFEALALAHQAVRGGPMLLARQM